MLCILPFEPSLCRAAGIPATFVGHPVLEDAWECQAASVCDACEIRGDGAAFRQLHGLPKGGTFVALFLLPGCPYSTNTFAKKPLYRACYRLEKDAMAPYCLRSGNLFQSKREDCLLFSSLVDQTTSHINTVRKFELRECLPALARPSLPYTVPKSASVDNMLCPPFAEERPTICFLPGSHRQETRRLLPIFQKTFGLLRRAWPILSAVVVTIPGPVGDEVSAHVAAWDNGAITCRPRTEQERYDAFAVSPFL